MKQATLFFAAFLLTGLDIRAGELVGVSAPVLYRDRLGPLHMSMLCQAAYPQWHDSIRVATLADLPETRPGAIPDMPAGGVAWILPTAPEQIGTVTHDCLAGTSQLSSHFGWSVTDNGFPALVRCGRLAYVTCAR